MKLFYTTNSPYARVCRVALRESGLSNIVTEIEAKTRAADTDYFSVTPLARVPALVDQGVLIADTRDICAYFDKVSDQRLWLPDETPTMQTQRHIATGFLDGIAVWLREMARPVGEKSLPVMRYEEHRARNAVAWLEQNVPANQTLSFTSLVLTCAIDIAQRRGMADNWTAIAPSLLKQVSQFLERPAFVKTVPHPI